MSRNRVLRAPGSWGDFFLFLESEIEFLGMSAVSTYEAYWNGPASPHEGC